MNNTFELLKQLIHNFTDVPVREESTIKELKLDSIDLVEILLEVEDELGIHFYDEELENLTTVKDVLNLVHNKK